MANEKKKIFTAAQPAKAKTAPLIKNVCLLSSCLSTGLLPDPAFVPF
jgi:hypothetical protein